MSHGLNRKTTMFKVPSALSNWSCLSPVAWHPSCDGDCCKEGRKWSFNLFCRIHFFDKEKTPRPNNSVSLGSWCLCFSLLPGACTKRLDFCSIQHGYLGLKHGNYHQASWESERDIFWSLLSIEKSHAHIYSCHRTCSNSSGFFGPVAAAYPAAASPRGPRACAGNAVTCLEGSGRMPPKPWANNSKHPLTSLGGCCSDSSHPYFHIAKFDKTWKSRKVGTCWNTTYLTYLHLAHGPCHSWNRQAPTALREQRTQTQHSCPGNELGIRFTSEKFKGRNPMMGPTTPKMRKTIVNTTHHNPLQPTTAHHNPPQPMTNVIYLDSSRTFMPVMTIPWKPVLCPPLPGPNLSWPSPHSLPQSPATDKPSELCCRMSCWILLVAHAV